MRFRVIGRNEQTQAEVVREVVCDTREDVEAFAVLAGIVIERIEPLPDSPAPAESADVFGHRRADADCQLQVRGGDSVPIEVTCQCGSHWEVDDSLAGQQILCSACNQRVTVPGPRGATVSPAPAESADVFGGIDPLPQAPGPAEFGPAPSVGLPDPLDDPLRALRRFLGWLMLVQIAFVVGWLVYSFTMQPQVVKVRTAELTIQGIILAFPFLLALWRLLPNRVVNAYYLRSFRHDAATPAVRRSLTFALGRQFRLSGIRDPRRRSIKVLRYLTVFLFALRYATAKYLNLEAGVDWKQRLWRSLGDAKCAVIDVSDLTPFVVQEIQLCFRCLGLNRMLFVVKSTSLKDAGAWKAAIGQIVNRPSDDSEIQLAVWDPSRAGRRAFEADVRRFADRLPAELAGLRHDAYPLGGSLEAIDDARGAWDGWVWLELGLGLAVASGLANLLKAALKLTGPAPNWVWLIFIPLLGILLCEFWQFLVYLKDCGTLRERCLMLLTFGFAWWWIGVGTIGVAVEKVQSSANRLADASHLQALGLAMINYEEVTGELPLADGVGASEPPGARLANADAARVRRLAERVREVEEPPQPAPKKKPPPMKLEDLARVVEEPPPHSTPPLAPPLANGVRAVEQPPTLPPISWRVAILPLLGEGDLFQEYNLNEPWDSPNNKRLVERMPKIYAMPGADKKPSLAVAGYKFLARKLNAMPGAEPGEEKITPPGHTYYRVFVSSPTGSQAAFTEGKPQRLNWFEKPSATILVLEAAEAVPWTQPDGLEYDPDRPLPKLGGHFPGVFQAVLASGEVRPFPSDMPQADLRGWITRKGGKAVPD